MEDKLQRFNLFLQVQLWRMKIQTKFLADQQDVGKFEIETHQVRRDFDMETNSEDSIEQLGILINDLSKTYSHPQLLSSSETDVIEALQALQQGPSKDFWEKQLKLKLESQRRNLFLRVQCLRMRIQEHYYRILHRTWGIYDVHTHTVWNDFLREANCDDSVEELSVLVDQLTEMCMEPNQLISQFKPWEEAATEVLMRLPKSEWAQAHYSRNIITPPRMSTNVMDLVQDIHYIGLLNNIQMYQIETQTTIPFPRHPPADYLQRLGDKFNVMTPFPDLQSTRSQYWTQIFTRQIEIMKKEISTSEFLDCAAQELLNRYGENTTYARNFLQILVNHCPEMVHPFCHVVRDLLPTVLTWYNKVDQPLFTESGEPSIHYHQGVMILNTATHLFCKVARLHAERTAGQLTELFFASYSQLMLCPSDYNLIAYEECIPDPQSEMQIISMWGNDGLFPESVLAKPRYLSFYRTEKENGV